MSIFDITAHVRQEPKKAYNTEIAILMCIVKTTFTDRLIKYFGEHKLSGHSPLSPNMDAIVFEMHVFLCVLMQLMRKNEKKKK